MDDLRELYQTVILDHNSSPRNFGELEDANRRADGYNPICGDNLTLFLRVAEGEDGERIEDARFVGVGCAISKASASLMTEFAKGRTVKEVDEAFARFHELVTASPDQPVDASELGKLAVFSGVREYPMRVKCATLAWHALRAAIDGAEASARTE